MVLWGICWCGPLVERSWADVRPSALRTFSFRIRDEPETLDWNRAHTMVESAILMNLMEGLVTLESGVFSKAGTKISPALAESWTLSQEGKVYTFKLRTGVKWSDGVLVKAQDFVYSWKRLLSPLTAASYAYLLFDIQGAEAFNRGMIQDFNQVGIKAIDSSTFQVTLNQPVAHWIYIPAFWVTFPLRQDIVDMHGEMWASPGRMVTTGPFVLMCHDIQSKIILRANSFYYGQRGNVDEVTAKIVKDDAVAMALYRVGDLDFLSDLASGDLKWGANPGDLKTFSHLKTGFLGFVTDKFPVSSVKIRRAIAMSIDKVKLISVLRGGQTPATTFVPPTLMGYSKNIGIPYNPALAMVELRNSGIDMVTSPVTIDYVLPDWDKSKIIGNFIKDEVKRNLGIDINLQATDNQSYRAKLDLRAFPLFDASWTADYPDPDSFLSVFLSNSGNSRTTWKSENFDQMVQLGRQSKTPIEREGIYFKLQKLLLEDEVVILPLYYEPNFAWVRSRVKNFELNSMDYLYLRNVSVGG